MLKKVETFLSVPWTKLTPSESKPLLHAYIGSIPSEGKKRMALKLAKRYMGEKSSTAESFIAEVCISI
jgi:hypothetical protein